MSGQPNTKSFHFQDINKIVIFPLEGNQGKYRNYNVQIKTVETFTQPAPPMALCEFLDSREVDNNYPHNVGYFKESTVQNQTFKPQYLTLRKIYSIEEFFLFLNEVSL